MMESTSIPPANTTCGLPTGPLDKLSYKELQVLAMSLNLPGKMKQGVLVEAIRARQNHNENAVAMILEANRQRKIMIRQHQQQFQQQQLMRLNAEKGAYLMANNGGSSRRKPIFPRQRMKRSASEMEAENYVIDDDMKRSKLAAALTQCRRPPFFNQPGLRKEYATGGTWEPACPEQIVQQLAVNNRPLPDLSKDLSVLPLSECPTTTSTPPSSDEPCSSIGSNSSWNSMSTNAEMLPNGSSHVDSCDSGWIGSPSEESYDSKPLLPPSSSNNNQCCYDASQQLNMANQTSGGYYEPVQQPGQPSTSSMYNSNNSEYRPDDFSTNNPNFTDYPPQCQIQNCQRSNCINPNPNQSYYQQHPVPLHIAVMTSRLWFDCYDANCYHKNAPLFRVQRPGNPSPLFVSSGRGFTLPTFCNMFSRVSSFVQ